ncbi:MAG: hypothetical protein MUE95_06030, partial [Cyclobacteriaceae bacterium]|nr:hypothetical protein [Cyclobacteriaceae bacterium]
MALNFKYNKIALYELNQQLAVRVRALPTLKSKEAALRLEIKKLRDKANEYEVQLQTRLEEVRNLSRLWVEFEEGLVRIREATYRAKVIAGVRIPVLDSIDFELA